MPPRFLGLSSLGLSSLGLTLALAAVVAALSVPAAAADRCEGTLCDLYYEHAAAPQPAAPAAPTRAAPAPQGGSAAAAGPNDSLLGRLLSAGATQPAAPAATAPAAPRKLVAVQGGGLVGMMNGAAPQRCTGTLCDFFYGGPPPETPAPGEAAVAPVADEVAAPQLGDAPVEAPSEVDTRPSCAADARDPWRCYRR